VAVSDGPGDYADDMECAWNITSVGPITIVFKAFSTEADYDFLTVVDGQSGDVLRRYTGTALPASLNTNATSLRVVFTSDGGVASVGFEIEAFALAPGGTWVPTALPTTGSPTGAPTAVPTWAAATGALGLSCATIAHDAHRTSRRTRTHADMRAASAMHRRNSNPHKAITHDTFAYDTHMEPLQRESTSNAHTHAYTGRRAHGSSHRLPPVCRLYLGARKQQHVSCHLLSYRDRRRLQRCGRRQREDVCWPNHWPIRTEGLLLVPRRR
jgi:hypothetical protein